MVSKTIEKNGIWKINPSILGVITKNVGDALKHSHRKAECEWNGWRKSHQASPNPKKAEGAILIWQDRL